MPGRRRGANGGEGCSTDGPERSPRRTEAASGDGRGVVYYRWLAISREGCVLDGVGGAGKLDRSLPPRVVLIDPAARRSSR